MRSPLYEIARWMTHSNRQRRSGGGPGAHGGRGSPLFVQLIQACDSRGGGSGGWDENEPAEVSGCKSQSVGTSYGLQAGENASGSTAPVLTHHVPMPRQGSEPTVNF